MFNLKSEAREWARDSSIDWSKLNGSSVLITGATGLIGSSCIRMLLARNEISDAHIQVIALVRSREKAESVFEGYTADDNFQLIEGDVCAITSDLLPSVDYIIHAGCPTASQFFVDSPVETADAIVLGTRNLLEIGREKNVRGFAYISSMEIYGAGNEAAGMEPLLSEAMVGYVNPLDVRSSYPEGKRMAELYCAAFAHEYQVPAVSIRLAQTFGPGIPRTDARLFALCARSFIEEADIVLRTKGESTRMYLYTMDAVTAILTALISGSPGQAYNAANPHTYSSVRELAEMTATLDNRKQISVRCDPDPNAPFAPSHHIPLDTNALNNLGWEPKLDLPAMLKSLIAYLEA